MGDKKEGSLKIMLNKIKGSGSPSSSPSSSPPSSVDYENPVHGDEDGVAVVDDSPEDHAGSTKELQTGSNGGKVNHFRKRQTWTKRQQVLQGLGDIDYVMDGKSVSEPSQHEYERMQQNAKQRIQSKLSPRRHKLPAKERNSRAIKTLEMRPSEKNVALLRQKGLKKLTNKIAGQFNKSSREFPGLIKDKCENILKNMNLILSLHAKIKKINIGSNENLKNFPKRFESLLKKYNYVDHKKKALPINMLLPPKNANFNKLYLDETIWVEIVKNIRETIDFVQSNKLQLILNEPHMISSDSLTIYIKKFFGNNDDGLYTSTIIKMQLNLFHLSILNQYFIATDIFSKFSSFIEIMTEPLQTFKTLYPDIDLSFMENMDELLIDYDMKLFKIMNIITEINSALVKLSETFDSLTDGNKLEEIAKYYDFISLYFKEFNILYDTIYNGILSKLKELYNVASEYNGSSLGPNVKSILKLTAKWIDPLETIIKLFETVKSYIEYYLNKKGESSKAGKSRGQVDFLTNPFHSKFSPDEFNISVKPLSLEGGGGCKIHKSWFSNEKDKKLILHLKKMLKYQYVNKNIELKKSGLSDTVINNSEKLKADLNECIDQLFKKKTKPRSSSSSSSSSSGQAGQDGQSTQAGQDGQSTQAGQDGQSTQAGQDGQSTQAGQDGQLRQSGHDGQSRQSGHDGQSRQAGQDGQSRQSGQDGQSRQAGQDDRLMNEQTKQYQQSNISEKSTDTDKKHEKSGTSLLSRIFGEEDTKTILENQEESDKIIKEGLNKELDKQQIIVDLFKKSKDGIIKLTDKELEELLIEQIKTTHKYNLLKKKTFKLIEKNPEKMEEENIENKEKIKLLEGKVFEILIQLLDNNSNKLSSKNINLRKLNNDLLKYIKLIKGDDNDISLMNTEKYIDILESIDNDSNINNKSKNKSKSKNKNKNKNKNKSKSKKAYDFMKKSLKKKLNNNKKTINKKNNKGNKEDTKSNNKKTINKKLINKVNNKKSINKREHKAQKINKFKKIKKSPKQLIKTPKKNSVLPYQMPDEILKPNTEKPIENYNLKYDKSDTLDTFNNPYTFNKPYTFNNPDILDKSDTLDTFESYKK